MTHNFRDHDRFVKLLAGEGRAGEDPSHWLVWGSYRWPLRPDLSLLDVIRILDGLGVDATIWRNRTVVEKLMHALRTVNDFYGLLKACGLSADHKATTNQLKALIKIKQRAR